MSARDKLHALIRAATPDNLPVIQSHQNQSPPKGDFVRVAVLSSKTVGQASTTPVDDDGYRFIYQLTTCACQVDYFGEDAEGQLQKIALRLRSEALKALSYQLDCAIQQPVAFTVMPESINGRDWHDRAMLEFTLQNREHIREFIFTIDTVDGVIHTDDYKQSFTAHAEVSSGKT